VFTATKPDYTNAFPGGNCALRVKEVLAIGGFDTRYKNNAFREESDMSMRMANLGYKIYFNPKVVLTHLAAPYGGNRVKTHLYDNPAFYKNELFFTLRFAKKGKKIESLKRKYAEYCLVVRHKQAYRRRYYFYLGLIVALWRTINNRQIIAKEVK
jgi:GT2 family glycosyltransferase